MATIHDVASLAGVSIATVSNVLNQNGKVTKKTEAAVLDAIAQLGYVPDYVKRSKKSTMTRTIGVITENICVSFASHMTYGISKFCHENGYQLMLSDLHMITHRKLHQDFIYDNLLKDQDFIRKLQSSVELLKNSGAQGIVYVGDHARDITPLLAHISLPCVAVHAYTQKQANCFCVNVDDQYSAQIIVEQLLKAGHSNIGIITGPTDSLVTHKRLMGYQEALMKHRVALNPANIYAGHWDYDDGKEALHYFIKLPNPPSAIFAMNDLMGIGVMNEAHKLNIQIPEQLSVAGFDCLEAALYSEPPLSTLRIPFDKMGYYAVKTLVESLHTPPDSHSLLIPGELVPGGTIASLK